MNITRELLHDVYVKLSDEEKKIWAEKAGYTSYAGLRSYLTRGNGVAYARVVDALKFTVGETKYKEFIYGSLSFTDNRTEKMISNDCLELEEIVKRVIDSSDIIKMLEVLKLLKQLTAEIETEVIKKQLGL